MGKKIFIVLVVALIGMLALPALASASTLVNDYGMHFAGQQACLDCHARLSGSLKVTSALHGEFAKPGIHPGMPATWARFKAAGDIDPVMGSGQIRFTQGGSYGFDLPWVTLGASALNSATEYLFFQGTKDQTVMPWNIVEGLSWEPSGEWVVGDGDKGLWDDAYGCQRCHMLGSTVPTSAKSPSATAVPNPAATTQPTLTTARQWAAEDTLTRVSDFMTSAPASFPGLGIQCEQCHGTGQYDAEHGHMSTKVDVSGSLDVLGQSQVCGQCHGSYTNLGTTLGIYGYTTNLKMRDFVDINGVSGGASYTKIPTEEEFAASPAAYWMYPNGSNAKGNHYYYNEWAASAHSYKGAYKAADPEVFAYQASGKSVYANNLFGTDTVKAGCYKCHTGEGYLQTKGDPIAQDFVPSQDTVGKMGQECITCHNGHPSAVGAEDVVREPDQAGERSAKGLSESNQSICEDCHNWELEVLGEEPEPAPMADLSAHSNPSHPQRETLHGREVMLDVAAGTEFMPGAKCEDCHMPKTNKAETRISHGMKPMLPGDAEKWQKMAGYSAGQDSCSTCHPSQTRDELQASIDGWQEAAEAQAAAVVTAITTARTKGEFSLTDGSKPGYVLVGRATWNYKAYEQDLSRSVHNPTYVMAGLKKAEQEALSVGGKFSVVSGSNSVKKNRHGHIAGAVVNGNGTPAVGARVTLTRGGTVLKSTRTDDDGHFAFTFKVTRTYKNYKVKWVRSGDPITDLYSKALTVKCVR